MRRLFVCVALDAESQYQSFYVVAESESDAFAAASEYVGFDVDSTFDYSLFECRRLKFHKEYPVVVA